MDIAMMEQGFKIPVEYQKVNKADAARIIGMSRPTFYRNYLDSGKISVFSDDTGKEFITFDELHRIFGEKALRGLHEHIGRAQKEDLGQMDTHKSASVDVQTELDTTELRIENARISERLTALQQRFGDYEIRLSEKDEQIRRYFDELQTTRRLLEDKSIKAQDDQHENTVVSVQQEQIARLEQKLSELSEALTAREPEKQKGFWTKLFGIWG